jgi:hypothetical protein
MLRSGTSEVSKVITSEPAPLKLQGL